MPEREALRRPRLGGASLADVFDLAVQGDRGAFAELVDRYSPIVRAVARRCGASVEDVSQETWARLYVHLADIQTPAALPGWLRTTAARLSWRMARRSADPAGVPVPLAEHDVHADDPEDAALRRLANDECLEALARLSTRDQRVLALTVLSEPALPYLRIADELGCPVGSIGPTRQRSLARLAQELLAVQQSMASRRAGVPHQRLAPAS